MASRDVLKQVLGRSLDSNPASVSKNLRTSPTTGPVTRAQRAKGSSETKPLKQQTQSTADSHLENQPQQRLPKAKLSKRNLRQLQSQLRSNPTQRREEDTERSVTDSIDSRVSQESTVMTASTVGHASYRYKTMLKANIFVQLFTLPENIQLRVNAIFSREVSVSKTSQIDGIVKRMAGDMMKRMQGQTMEAHYLTIIFKGLEAMDSEGEFCLCPQYKCDPTLQPRGRVMRVSFNLGNVDQVDDELRDNPQRSRKRQRTDSPSDVVLEETQGSESVKHSSVKVPCSDFTMGLSTDTLAVALSTKYGVPVWQAQAFLQQLEAMEGFRPHPYKNPVGYWFPTLVIEAKAFSAGRSLFEAENQAAVSACYMLNALQRFADSYDGAVQQAIPPPTPIGKDTPLVFSITVYGPLLQLWVHYALKHNNSTSYHMNILKSCHACVTSELQAFLAMVDQIMSWNKAEVLPEMMNQVVQLSNILDFEAIVLEG